MNTSIDALTPSILFEYQFVCFPFAGHLGAIHRAQAWPPLVELHVRCGRGPLHDVELPTDLLLRCGVPFAAPSCTSVWVATRVASTSDVHVSGTTQVSAPIYLYVKNKTNNEVLYNVIDIAVSTVASRRRRPISSTCTASTLTYGTSRATSWRKTRTRTSTTTSAST